MPAQTWPPTLPQSPLQGFREQRGDNTIRSDTTAGVAKTRKRYTIAVHRLSFSMRMTEIQKLAAFAFYDEVGGHSKFEFPDPRTSGAPFVVCRFVGAPGATYEVNGYYTVTMELEILPDAPS